MKERIKKYWFPAVSFLLTLLVALFWIVIYFISTAAQDPFLYFKY